MSDPILGQTAYLGNHPEGHVRHSVRKLCAVGFSALDGFQVAEPHSCFRNDERANLAVLPVNVKEIAFFSSCSSTSHGWLAYLSG